MLALKRKALFLQWLIRYGHSILGASLKVVANTLGLNDSKYQYVIDALEADEIRKQREEQDEEDRRQVGLASCSHT